MPHHIISQPITISQIIIIIISNVFRFYSSLFCSQCSGKTKQNVTCCCSCYFYRRFCCCQCHCHWHLYICFDAMLLCCYAVLSIIWGKMKKVYQKKNWHSLENLTTLILVGVSFCCYYPFVFLFPMQSFIVGVISVHCSFLLCCQWAEWKVTSVVWQYYCCVQCNDE